MSEKIIYIGLDVDDQNFHGCALNPESGEMISFKCHPTIKSLESQLDRLKKLCPLSLIKICYEATHIAFTLQRQLSELGYHCDVVAPSSIPRVNNNAIKTDRIDAQKLASFYASGLLTCVRVPELENEQDRDLMRSRGYVVEQLKQLKTHLQSLLRRNNLHFKLETKNLMNWTSPHLAWLEKKSTEAKGAFGVNFSILLDQIKTLKLTIQKYDRAIDELAASEKYKTAVESLTVYKGIKNIFAMVMITEIGDIKRFAHPRQLVSYMGMDVREYSSGGKQQRFGITKCGNKYLRTAFVESNQKIFRSKGVGKALEQRRKNADPAFIAIADRCMTRLVVKGARLIHAGKHVNKVKVACGREMAGFVWESLNRVAA